MHTSTKEQQDIISFPLAGVLPVGHHLVVHTLASTVSQLAIKDGVPVLICLQIFAPGEICLLLPLLESYPDYCPTEVLFASIGGKPTERDIERARKRLHQSLDNGTWTRETQPVRNLLSRVRLKMHAFGIDIYTIMQTGYGLKIRTRGLAVSHTD